VRWLFATRDGRCLHFFSLERELFERAFRPEALALDAVALACDDGLGALRGLVSPADLAAMRASPLHGLYSPEQRLAVSYARRSAAVALHYFVTAHELCHAALWPRAGELTAALYRDVPRLLAAREAALGADGFAGWRLDQLVARLAGELAAYYAAAEYFVLLRRDASLGASEALDAAARALGREAFGSIDIAARELGRALAELREYLRRHAPGVAEWLELAFSLPPAATEASLPSLRETAHSAIARAVREWPADVMEGEPKLRELLSLERLGGMMAGEWLELALAVAGAAAAAVAIYRLVKG
jgi:hypothetical protein